MRDRSRDEKHICAILGYIKKIKKYVANQSREAFIENDMCLDACILMLSEIGERVVKLSDDFKSDNAEIAWQEIKNMRNIMIHDYEGINYNLIWDTINEDIPELEEKLVKINM